ncbi:bifunctional diguanylate cyclase/phosphodiesterase [Rugamonas sp.]|uniref:putative bifunctional diguanylate cyclase/phosphodiesterase n=1 Tax=Rugamonas sp. TaxID=1926287 RepID=UPI0025CDF1EA|nr:GGDEF domain-containing phosphodiesterase [Rugamonas sp.]
MAAATRLTPAAPDAADDLAHWRAQIFARLLLAVLALGTVTAVPSIVLEMAEHLWSVAAMDVVAMAWLCAIRFSRLSYRSRMLNFLGVTFLVGVGLMVKIGPATQIYLMAIPVLAALLLGLWPALATLALTSAAVMTINLTASASLQPYTAALTDNAVLTAAIFTINFAFVGAILTLPCSVLLRHLARSLEQQRLTSASLAAGRDHLHALNAELRLTSAAVARLNDMVLIAEITADEDDGGDADHADHADHAGQRIIFVNDAFERRSGYSRAEVLGRGLRLLQGPATDAATLARLAHAMAHAEAVRAELLNYTRGGEPYWVETELVPFADEGGKHTHWVAVERDITQRKRAEDDIHRLAFYDVLTALPNRRLLMDRLTQLLAGAVRGATFSAVLFVDLDRFKFINDARGHATGDALLQHAAARLAQLVRKADTVARIGGDEFVVLLADVGRAADGLVHAGHAARLVAEKIRDALARDFDIDGQHYSSSASIGVTLLPRGGQSAADLLREADTAMYRAKAGGRNGVVFFEAAMQADVERRLTMENELAQALAHGALEMHYQPQVDRHGRVAGAELLMRWRRADGSMVPPAQFIPVAEESGLIVALRLWALRQACAAVLRLAEAGHRIALSVNVSPSQFRQPDFVAQVRAALRDSGAPAQQLIFEVTEGLLVDKLDDTVARMGELAALGIRFSIDDFGTGYSSLAYLKKMPLYELKIDRGFIQGTPADADGTAIVQAILAMARHLRLRVVAEGVETRAQADFLIGADCDCLQGYLYARPDTLDQLLRYLDGVTASR